MFMKKILLSALFLTCASIVAIAGNNVFEMNSRSQFVNNGKFRLEGKDNQLVLPERTSKPLSEDVTPVTVTLTSTHDPSNLMVWSVLAYNENGLTPLYGMSDTGTMQLAPGTYDFLIRYTNWSQDESYFVVRENVNVTEAMSLSFDPAEATNAVTFVPLDQNGTKLEVAEFEYVLDDNGNWDVKTVKEGNSQGLGFSNDLLVEGYGYITGTFISASGGSYTSIDKSTTININNLSDRYTIAYNYLITGNTNEFYYICGQLGGVNGSTELKNDPATYNSISQEFDLYVPENLNPDFISRSDDYTFLNGVYDNGWVGGGCYMPGSSKRSLNYWQCAPVNKGNSVYDYQLLFSPGIAYLHVLEESEYTRTCGIDASPARFEGGKLHSYFTGNGIYLTDMPKASSSTDLKNIKGLPGVLPFSFTADDTDLLPGSSVPMLCFKVQDYVSWTSMPYFSWDLEYRGNLGELRSCDLDLLKPVVKYGGVVQEVNDYDELYSYPAKLTNSEDTELKKIEVSLSVDTRNGKGKAMANNANIVMDLTKEDFVPPTLRMMQLRNESNLITNTFVPGSDINVAAIAGDFNFDRMTGCIVSAAASVEFYYAPTGTTEWTSINMTEDNEFSSCNFGNFYRGVISNLSEGVYDMKVSLTDQSGNSQEQVMTNTFTVSNNSSVDTIADESAEITEIYDLFGRRVVTPQSGSIYICNGRKMVWK